MNRNTIEQARQLAETNKRFRDMVFNDPDLFKEIYGEDAPTFSDKPDASRRNETDSVDWQAPAKYKKNTDNILSAWLSSINKEARPYAIGLGICFVLAAVVIIGGVIAMANTSDFASMNTAFNITFGAFFVILFSAWYFDLKLASKENVSIYRAFKARLFHSDSE